LWKYFRSLLKTESKLILMDKFEILKEMEERIYWLNYVIFWKQDPNIDQLIDVVNLKF
jgi:hypothetical protein